MHVRIMISGNRLALTLWLALGLALAANVGLTAPSPAGKTT
jgi:hypothetical protein